MREEINIDNIADDLSRAYQDGYNAGYADALAEKDLRTVVLCKDCRHRDPEDYKCDCGGTERQGCPFRVKDNYFCAYGEK